jgi:hypothetical protein
MGCWHASVPTQPKWSLADQDYDYLLVDQDTALSGLRPRFESPWGHLRRPIPNHIAWLKNSLFWCWDKSIERRQPNCSLTESDWFGMFVLIGKSSNKKARTYIPVKAACKLSGYNQQYLRRLLRREKLGGIKVGQVWLIETLSLESHLSLGNQGQDRRYGPQIRKKCNSTKYLD